MQKHKKMGSDWDLRLFREHRKTLALDSGFPAWLVFLPFVISLSRPLLVNDEAHAFQPSLVIGTRRGGEI